MKMNSTIATHFTDAEINRLGEDLAKRMKKAFGEIDKKIGGNAMDDYEHFGRNSYFRGRLENQAVPCGGFVVFAGSLLAPFETLDEKAREEREYARSRDLIDKDPYGREYLNKNVRFLSGMHAKWFVTGKRSGTSGMKKVFDKTVKFCSVRNAFVNPKGVSRVGQMLADKPTLKRERISA